MQVLSLILHCLKVRRRLVKVNLAVVSWDILAVKHESGSSDTILLYLNNTDLRFRKEIVVGNNSKIITDELSILQWMSRLVNISGLV